MTLDRLGGISIYNNNIQIKTNTTFLGYSFSNFLSETEYVNTLCKRSKLILKRLYRFRSAPIKVKKYLYSTLIRSVLDYPCTELDNTTKKNIRAMQIVQNKALRYILNVSMYEGLSNETLHNRLKMDTINIRHSKLAKKILYKMKNLYMPTDDNVTIPYLRLLSDDNYNLPDNPIKQPRKSVAEFIANKIYYAGYDRIFKLNNLPDDSENYPIPLPIYG